MAKKAGSKVGEAFIELGLDQAPLAKALASAQTTFRSSLQTMGQQATKFARGVGGKLGFAGIGGAAGLGAAFAVGLNAALELEGGIERLALAARVAGVPFADLNRAVEESLPSMKQLGTATHKQAMEITRLGRQYGFAGDELQNFNELAVTFASFTGKDPVAAAGLLRDALKGEGGAAKALGVLTAREALPATVSAATLDLGAKLRPGARAAGKLPSRVKGGIGAGISDLFSAISEATLEAALDPKVGALHVLGTLYAPFTRRGYRQGRLLANLPEDLRGLSQYSERTAADIAEAYEPALQSIYGLAPDQRAHRGGELGVGTARLTDEERHQQLEVLRSIDEGIKQLNANSATGVPVDRTSGALIPMVD